MTNLLNSHQDTDACAQFATSWVAPSRFYARVVIGNRNQVAAVFGGDVALEFLAVLHNRAATIMKAAGIVSWNDDRLDILVDEPIRLSGGASCRSDRATLWFEHHLIEGLSRPVEVAGLAILPLLSIAAVRLGDDGQWDGTSPIAEAQASVDAVLRQRGISSPWHDPVYAVTDDYVADMRAAAGVGRAIAEGSLFLVWQPIVDQAGARILYSEGLCRIVDRIGEFGRSGEIVLPGAFIPALERTGLVRALDAHIVAGTIARLWHEPNASLGCNISAKSAVLDGWWFSLLEALDADRELARRLTIEITETAALPSLVGCHLLVRTLRACGCRVAIDDFGVGHTTVPQITALSPDVIKIDAHFLWKARDEQSLPSLQALILLASSLAADVVVEGVEDRTTNRLAAEAGGRWLQGNFVAGPSLTLVQRPSDDAGALDRILPARRVDDHGRTRGLLRSLAVGACLCVAVIGAWYNFV